MIKIGIGVALVLLLVLLAIAINRYRKNPSDANIWLIAWIFTCFIVLVGNLLVSVWLFNLKIH